jgi:hypothetical protein
VHMGHSADGFGRAQFTWASQIGLEARPARAGSPRPKQGSSLPMARRRRLRSIPAVAGGEGSGERVLEQVGSAGIRFGVHLGPRNSPGCGPPRWWAAAGGERHGERRPVAVAPSSWLGEVRGAQAVLAMASARRFHGQRCRSAWKRSRR